MAIAKSMLQLLRAVYPQACLTVEIASVEGGNYLIRAIASTEGIVIANAFAVSPDLEVAQDKALQRLFKMLAIAPQPLPELEISPKSQPSSDVLTTSDELGNSNYSDSALLPIKPFKPSQPETQPIPEFLPSTLLEPESLPSEKGEPSSPPPADEIEEISHKSVIEPSVNALPVPSASRSELLNLTQLEIKRLGWTNKKGSEHLYKMYGKKVRNELTDAELQDFCDYLQSLT